MQTKTSQEIKIFTPSMYHVVLYNDDKTTMDFVVEILIKIFNKTTNQAIETMLKIHNNGSEICGTYIKEIAITKLNLVKIAAQKANFPLRCDIKKG
ncbi:ATP-dependent Clp protease adaptor ClpS [Campylobacter sp. FMV-PI01]|uniref:ATP-dependent Clp protease adapter protein ClpS n=1 Tax=Campylobacter portucalensis TaxID=2608384 RepID=A0A6L5WLI8_9BACT|nr:ATP-dependent Clp protease adaptor ClpS [Campylobacter portucalensis]MSN96673.1 ATP-dependent Clp protease adaptor ClpS [Campylobacter portucalensis]